MNKIIVAFDGLQYSQSAEQYGIEIAKKTGAHLVAVLLEDLLTTVILTTILYPLPVPMKAGCATWMWQMSKQETRRR